MKSLRIVTWNIAHGRNLEQAGRELRTLTSLRTAGIILLQEMDEPGTAALSDGLNMSYVYAAAATHRATGRRFGNSILSRWTISDEHEIHLPHLAVVSGQPRSALCATVHAGGLAIRVYSTHTEIPLLSLRRRRVQFDGIAADVATSGARNAIVGGDFNTPTSRSRSALHSAMTRAGLDAATTSAGPTFTRFGHGFVLDHLFVAGLQVVSSGVEPAARASDHQPLWCDLASPTR